MALDYRFDPHLAQAENLTTLFVAMHDGVRMCVCINLDMYNMCTYIYVLYMYMYIRVHVRTLYF